VGFPQQVASITGSGIITDSGSAATLTVTGGGNFSGDITGTASLSTTGSGTLTLGGDDTYTGGTTITSGTLLVTGNLTESAVSVLPSGTIGGTGTVQGLSISGDLAPGVNEVGTLTAEGNTTFTNANAEFSVQLDGTGPGSSNQLAESGGTVDLGTQTTLVVTQTVPTSTGQVFTIISGAGNITGTFVGLANNATFVSDGLQYQITYSTGSVTLTDIGSALTPATLPPGEVGLGYNQTITPVAGSPPATLSVSGVTNPTGLAISGSGTDTISVSGTPTATGTVSFTVTPTYASGTGIGTVYSFTVNPPIILSPATLPTGEVGLAYSQSITASGGSGAITLALSGVTNTTGLTISGNGTGTISIAGTPTSAGTVTFTVTPTDSIGTLLTVAPPARSTQ
jgi:fibronectin-binding autotransporter adhesin